MFQGGFNNFMSFCTLSDGESRLVIGSYVAFMAYIGWCALSHGTSVIAPVAENHSTLRRLIALGLACIAAASGLHNAVDPNVLMLVFGIILTPAVITALTERSTLLPPVCKPFLKRGLPGRIASIVLLPGWPAGVFYTLLLLAVSAAGIAIAGGYNPTTNLQLEMITASLGVLGGVLLAALLAANFTKQEDKRFTNFMAFQLLSILLAVIPMIFASINNRVKLLWFFIWNPPVSVFMTSNGTFDKGEVLTAVAIVDAIILFALLITAAGAYRGYRKTFDEAEAELTHSAVPAS